MAALLGVILALFLPVIGVAFLWVSALSDDRYLNVVYKLHLLRLGIAHLFFSTDKKFPKYTPLPKNIKIVPGKKRRIVFVRHAESQWNEVFNKGFGLDFPQRLFSALAAEARMITTADSVFFDSPLSRFGASQAAQLKDYVERDFSKEDIGSSVIVSSNLRRALSTILTGFKSRLETGGEKVKILSSLQEVTFNVDGVSLAKPHDYPQLNEVELEAIGVKSVGAEWIDALGNEGNKSVKSSGMKRMLEFCEWVFKDEQAEYDTIIVAGHSLYFRYFFRYFLDASDNHRAKKYKMANCSVVAFDLEKGSEGNEPWYRIPEDSLKEMFIGFESKGKKE